MWVLLLEEEYLDGEDEHHICPLVYEVTGTPGSADPEAWLDWSLTLGELQGTDHHLFGPCERLDPSVWGEDPGEYFRSWDWEMTIHDMDEALAAYMPSELGVSQEEWDDDRSDYHYASSTYLNGSLLEADIGTHYGKAYLLEDWHVSSDLMPLVTVAREQPSVASHSDGYYTTTPVVYWAL